MEILIIEDDMYKYSRVNALVVNTSTSFPIFHCDSLYCCIQYLRKNKPGKIILDMSLPSHSAKAGEGAPISMPNGGVEVLMVLNAKRWNNIPIIILTQYPEIEIEGEYYPIDSASTKLKELFNFDILEVAFYEHDSDEWTSKVNCFLRQE